MSKYKTICLDKVSMEVEYPPEGREASLAERVRTWLPLLQLETFWKIVLNDIGAY